MARRMHIYINTASKSRAAVYSVRQGENIRNG